jgi:hypothetical protein
MLVRTPAYYAHHLHRAIRLFKDSGFPSGKRNWEEPRTYRHIKVIAFEKSATDWSTKNKAGNENSGRLFTVPREGRLFAPAQWMVEWRVEMHNEGIPGSPDSSVGIAKEIDFIAI